MKNETFTIDGLGNIEFLVSLLTVDYSRIFVGIKRISQFNFELYLFEEIEIYDDSIAWACTQISYDELDRLNQGYLSIYDCFCGPRRSPRPGYKVISSQGDEIAKKIKINDVSQLVDDDEYYPEQFVEENHGAGTLSLVFGTPVFSIIQDAQKFASPITSPIRFEKGSNEGRSLIQSLPYSAIAEGVSWSNRHSMVLNFIVKDKEAPSINYDQTKLFETESLSESSLAIKALDTLLSEESTEEERLNAVKGDKKTLEKCVSFLNEVGKTDSNNTIQLQLVDPLANHKKIESVNDTVLKNLKEKLDNSINIINKSKVKEDTLNLLGYFVMLDTQGKKRFKFVCESPQGKKEYSGQSTIDFNKKDIPLNLIHYQYLATIEEKTYIGEFGKTKPIYTLVDLKQGDEQLTLNTAK